MKHALMMTVAAFATAACSAEEPGRLPLAAEPAEVTVAAATRGPATEVFPATVVSERTAEVATRTSGIVRSVAVDVGDAVRTGQVLLRLDGEDIQARVAAADAHLALARRSHERVGNLAADGAASQAELDGATAALRAAEATLAEARAHEAYVVVTAPFAGVVTRRSVNPGDLAVPGHPLLTLVAPGELEVVADLPATRAGTVARGARLRVLVAGVDAPLSARVDRVVGALGAGSRTFRVEAALRGAPASVLPGAYARIELPDAGEGSQWIPADAVVTRGQLQGVYALESDTLRLRWVRLGRRVGEAVELLAGPTGSLTVVRDPAPELHDGRAVGRVTRRDLGMGVSLGADR